MNFLEKRKEQLGIKSLGDLRREGKVTTGLNKNLLIKASPEFDCLVNGWQRQEIQVRIGDSGCGKTETVLIDAMHVLKNNPTSNVLFISLEMTAQKIGERWFSMTKDCPDLCDRFFIISRYDDQGKARNVSMQWVKNEIIRYQETLGDIVMWILDHLHVLGENDPSTLNSIMATTKEIAVETNSYGIVLAQVNKSSGQKGEVPLDSDAILGSSQAKFIASEIIQIHRPILRLEEEAGMSVLGWGYAKIREPHSNDKVKRGQNKLLTYDNQTRELRNLNTEEFAKFKMYYNMLLEMKSAEEKNKAFTYDIKKEIIGKDGRVIVINEKFSGNVGDDF